MTLKDAARQASRSGSRKDLTMPTPNTIKIDDVEYVRADALAPPPTGTRAVVVVDRGWIFAGDVTETNQDGARRIRLDRAVHVFRWESIGFDGMIAQPKSPKVTLKPLANPVDLPADAEVFRVVVADDWGL